MSDDLLNAALAYAKRGWAIFPCNLNKSPKTTNGVLDATTDPARIRQWWTAFPDAGIGLDCGGAGFMVLDMDPGHDKAELTEKLGGLPDTLMRARTPRGGEHWFYALAPGEIVSPSASKLAQHVDVRSHNSYVLLPPSRTVAGEYQWISEGTPKYRTDEMVRLSNSHREKHAERHNWIIEQDLPGNVEKAIAYLRTKAAIATEGVDGDHKAFATATMCRSFGLSPAKSYEVIMEHWSPRCLPPFDGYEDLIWQKCENAEVYATSPPGNCTDGYQAAKTRELFKAVEPGSTTEPPTGRFRVSTLPELERRTPPEWLVDEVIPEKGYTIIYGAPGSFKTFLALDVALSIACWQPWSGKATKPGRVLYCMGEGSFDADKRIRAWLAHKGCKLDPNTFKLIEPAPMIKLESDRREFLKEAHQHGPWDLIVIDTVGRAMAGLDDNSTLGARMFTDFTTEIREYLNAATLAVTHAPKDRPETLLGSGAYEADADCIYNSTVATKGDKINLRQHKIKYGAPWEKKIGFKKVVAGESMALEPCEAGKTIKDAEKVVQSTYEAQFLMCLARCAKDAGEALWPDVRASMATANDTPPENLPKFRAELQNWFTRWPRRAEYDTGRRGANNSVILRGTPS